MENTQNTDKTLDIAFAEDRSQEASKEVLGFWIYILSDAILFASFFAAFAVLRGNTFGGPTASEIFSLPHALAETLILLTSSFTSGIAILMIHRKQKSNALMWFVITAILGFTFLILEGTEFAHLVQTGAGPGRSAFLSSFFALVGLHGLHVTGGLVWMSVLLVQLVRRGISSVNTKKLLAFALFWHFLDIIWIFIFTIVYLMSLL
jgi:cytochrome o ubiquinol oxidase subunit 3